MVKENLAMTGEISLTGNVLPVGGIRQKVLAANSVGINQVILPEANRGDFEQLEGLEGFQLDSHFAKNIWTVLKLALDGEILNETKLAQEMIRLHKL